MIRLYVVVGILGLLSAGCGGNPYLDASLEPAQLEGKDQAWFEENWGSPSAKTSRFLGEKVGSILALPVEKHISHFGILRRISAKLHWILIKTNSLTTTTIRIVSVSFLQHVMRYLEFHEPGDHR